MKNNKTLILAHRGFSKKAPENTKASFRKAVEAGADGVEFDVQLSSDGIPVVIHDETLERTTTGKGWVKDKSSKKLSKLDAGTHFDPCYSEEGVPTLREVLEIVKNMRVINIEFKNSKVRYEGLEKRALALVKKFNLLDQVIFSSFNHYSIKNIKKLEPNARTGILYYAKLYQPWEYAAHLGIKNLHAHYFSIDRQMVEKCQENGININVYGANKNHEIDEMIKMGINIIITSSLEEAMKIRENI